jgi:murein L,D-transpeptidase YcbB/YkuD
LASTGRLEDLRWPDFPDYQKRVQSFYESTGYALAWIEHGEATPAAKSMIEVFKEAESKGLNPEDYDGSRWADRVTALTARKGGDKSESGVAGPARFDLALTVCVMRYISDLHFGKANPGLLHNTYDLDREMPDLAAFIRDRLLHATSVNTVLDGIEPPYEGYRRTAAVLQKYRAMSQADSIGPLPLTAKPVEPGKAYPAAMQLAGILRQLGDLPADAALPADSKLYAGPLVDAVKRFQSRHGLDTDGRLGKATVAQLNTPLSQRVRQLQLTLERWRWAPHNFPTPPVVVNIPEFELRALDRDYHTALEMKVVVGKSFHHQTPVFSAEMNSVGFWPYWDVPLSIQRAELVPKLVHDPSYLAKNNFEVVTVKREVVSTGDVDDALLARLRSLELRIRQVPGPKNSLGLIKFAFPNSYDVYMHDTPVTELFTRTRRDFSHGCIRLEKPERLAAWVLRDKPEWTPERIHEAVHGGKTFEVKLDRPIPVLIVYATALVLANGEVHFLEDIYGLDAQLEQILAKGYPYPAWQTTSDVPGPRPRE